MYTMRDEVAGTGALTTVLGMDIGTTSVKAALYSADGTRIADSFVDCTMRKLESGVAEQAPELWWDAVVNCSRTLVRSAPDAAGRIGAIGVSCANAVVAVDSRANAVSNAVMQLDGRAAAGVPELRRRIDRPEMYQRTVNRLRSAIVTAPLIAWHMSELSAKQIEYHCVLTPGGFINARMTGEFGVDLTRASISGLLDFQTLTWATDVCQAVGIDPNRLPRPVPANTISGYLTGSAAREMGLREGIPVAGGAMDTVAAGLGVGASSAGQAFVILGSVGRVCVPSHSLSRSESFIDVVYVGNARYMAMAPFGVAGAAVRWLAELIGLPSVSDVGSIDELAIRSSPGAEGVVFLPYLTGEWAPRWNADTAGAIWGLRLSHQNADIVRALLEGIAFAIRENLESAAKQTAAGPDRLLLAGGGARSRVWPQIIADVVGVPVAVPLEPECETRGAAILAATAAGLDVGKSALSSRPGTDTVFLPDASRSNRYRKAYQRYLRIKHMQTESPDPHRPS